MIKKLLNKQKMNHIIKLLNNRYNNYYKMDQMYMNYIQL